MGEAFCDGVLSDFGDSLLTRDVVLAFVTVTDVRFTLFRLLAGGGYSYGNGKNKILLKEKLFFFVFAMIYVDQALERSADIQRRFKKIKK